MKNSTLVLKKIYYYIFALILFILILEFFLNNYDLANEKYGINIWTFTYIFIISEALFNTGIYLMLKGSGIFNITIKDFFQFKFENLQINNSNVYLGLILNRVGAIAPWIYVLIAGGKRLPWSLISLLVIEICIVVFISYSIKTKIMSTSHKKSKVVIRKVTPSDIPGMLEVENIAWPPNEAATKEMLISRVKTFLDGIYVACRNNKIIGVIMFQLIKYDGQKDKIYSWYELTDNGFIRKSHDRNGNSIFGIDLSVIPDAPSGIGTKLLKQVGREAIKRNLQYGILGARIPTYHLYADKHTPEEYLKLKNEQGEMLDPEIRFYTRNKLEIEKIIPNYYHDPESLNYGVLLKWKNPFYIKNKKIGKIAGRLLNKLFKI